MIPPVTPDSTVLELVEYYPETEAVFEIYTKRIGICICCEALFCTLTEVSGRYGLDIEELIGRLNCTIK